MRKSAMVPSAGMVKVTPTGWVNPGSLLRPGHPIFCCARGTSRRRSRCLRAHRLRGRGQPGRGRSAGCASDTAAMRAGIQCRSRPLGTTGSPSCDAISSGPGSGSWRLPSGLGHLAHGGATGSGGASVAGCGAGRGAAGPRIRRRRRKGHREPFDDVEHGWRGNTKGAATAAATSGKCPRARDHASREAGVHAFPVGGLEPPDHTRLLLLLRQGVGDPSARRRRA